MLLSKMLNNCHLKTGFIGAINRSTSTEALLHSPESSLSNTYTSVAQGSQTFTVTSEAVCSWQSSSVQKMQDACIAWDKSKWDPLISTGDDLQIKMGILANLLRKAFAFCNVPHPLFPQHGRKLHGLAWAVWICISVFQKMCLFLSSFFVWLVFHLFFHKHLHFF